MVKCDDCKCSLTQAAYDRQGGLCQVCMYFKQSGKLKPEPAPSLIKKRPGRRRR